LTSAKEIARVEAPWRFVSGENANGDPDDFQRKVLELTADITQAQFELNFFGLKAVALRKKI
jgi:hypothetical protein